MKVEFIKETSPLSNEDWYAIYVDGYYKTGSSNENQVKKLYFEIISDPSMLEKKKEILHSAEFIVPSEDTKTQL
jgi:hypothetical protein